MARKNAKTAAEIRLWILEQVRRVRGCEQFNHRFEITANLPFDGTWVHRPSPLTSNPCTLTFEQKVHEAQSLFDLKLL